MKIVIVLAMLIMAMAIALAAAATTTAVSEEETFNDTSDDNPLADRRDLIMTSLRGASRFLPHHPPHYYRPAAMTCDKYPRVCRAKGSSGPDCCRKKCVNVIKDRFNCGKCGKKCKYGQICCNGECVNVMFNKKHCGVCQNKCKKGSSCTYGMCSYA